MKTYDAIIIGSGQAGTPLAKKLAGAGMKTAIIEKGLVGGTCVNVGCTPTKTWVASAKAVYVAQNSAALGVPVTDYSVDMPLIKKRKDDIVAQFRGGSIKGLEGADGLDLIFGEAAFTGEKTLIVKLTDGGTQELTADLIFINAGEKRPSRILRAWIASPTLLLPPSSTWRPCLKTCLSSAQAILVWSLGQMFRRFGSKVTMLEKAPTPLPREDSDVAEEMVKLLEAEGIKLYTDASVVKVKKANGHIEADILIGGKKHVFTYSHVLVAAGRTPQTKALNLKAAGVETDDKGYIKVNDKLETNIKGIYALGDINGGPAFTHIAYNDYTIVYRNIIEKANLSTKGRLVPYCMFTDPPLGRVGLSEAEAEKMGINFKVAKLPMAHVARAIEVGDTRGFMKAVVDADTKKILGVAILGQEGGEIMSVLQMAMQGGITYDEIRFMVFAHPTYSESLNNLFMAIEPI